MPKEITIKFYSDPGHGWGAVKRKLLDDMGVSPHISTYSYQRGATVYLEEDCDLSLLVRTLKAKGVTIRYIEKSSNNRSPIRTYDYFRP